MLPGSTSMLIIDDTNRYGPGGSFVHSNLLPVIRTFVKRWGAYTDIRANVKLLPIAFKQPGVPEEH